MSQSYEMQTANPRGFRFLEHTSDAYVEAWGPSLEAAFANAAAGFYETMLNIQSVEPEREDEVDVEGHDEKELLYNWLESFLLKFDIDGMVYSKYEIGTISAGSTPVTLHAKIRGEKYDRRKHDAKEEIKGVTYHQMEIEKHPDKITLRFILDL